MEKEITVIKDTDLGGQLNPVSNNNELKKVIGTSIEGCYNTYIYTKGTFNVETDILEELKKRNITLVGLAFAHFVNNLEKSLLEGTSDITPKGLMSELSKSEMRYINDNK